MTERLLLPALERRFVVAHYHLMKNAGSTIAAILKREFGGGFVDLDTDSPNGVLTPSDLKAHLEANPHIRALTSHQIRLPALESEAVIVFECCFIRHPIDRLASLYAYLQKAGDASPAGALAAARDWRGFLSGLLDQFPHMVCNPQTTVVANAGRFTRPPDGDDCERATEIMRKIAVPGVVNRFDESLAVAEYFLQPAFPGLRLHYTAENVSRPPRRPLAEREDELRERCGEPLYEELRRLNEWDWRLFHATEHEVLRRAALVPSFAKRLAALEGRSGAGSGAALHTAIA